MNMPFFVRHFKAGLTGHLTYGIQYIRIVNRRVLCPKSETATIMILSNNEPFASGVLASFLINLATTAIHQTLVGSDTVILLRSGGAGAIVCIDYRFDVNRLTYLK